MADEHTNSTLQSARGPVTIKDIYQDKIALMLTKPVKDLNLRRASSPTHQLATKGKKADQKSLSNRHGSTSITSPVNIVIDGQVPEKQFTFRVSPRKEETFEPTLDILSPKLGSAQRPKGDIEIRDQSRFVSFDATRTIDRRGYLQDTINSFTSRALASKNSGRRSINIDPRSVFKTSTQYRSTKRPGTKEVSRRPERYPLIASVPRNDFPTMEIFYPHDETVQRASNPTGKIKGTKHPITKAAYKQPTLPNLGGATYRANRILNNEFRKQTTFSASYTSMFTDTSMTADARRKANARKERIKINAYEAYKRDQYASIEAKADLADFYLQERGIVCSEVDIINLSEKQLLIKLEMLSAEKKEIVAAISIQSIARMAI